MYKIYLIIFLIFLHLIYSYQVTDKTHFFNIDNQVYGDSNGCVFNYVLLIEKESTDPVFQNSTVVLVEGQAAIQYYFNEQVWLGLATISTSLTVSGKLSLTIYGVEIITNIPFECIPQPYPIGNENQPVTFQKYRSYYYAMVKFNFGNKTANLSPINDNYDCTLSFVDYDTAFIKCRLGDTDSLTTISPNILIPFSNPLDPTQTSQINLPTFLKTTNTIPTPASALIELTTTPYNTMQSCYFQVQVPQGDYFYSTQVNGTSASSEDTLFFGQTGGNNLILYGFNYGPGSNELTYIFEQIVYYNQSGTNILSIFSNETKTISTMYSVTFGLGNWTPFSTFQVMGFKEDVYKAISPFFLTFGFKNYNIKRKYTYPDYITDKLNQDLEILVPYVDSGYLGVVAVSSITEVVNAGGPDDQIPPTIQSIEFIKIPKVNIGYKTLLRMQIMVSDSKVFKIMVNDGKFIMDASSIVSGSGTFEQIIDYTYSNSLSQLKFSVYDIAGNIAVYEQYLKSTPIGLLPHVVQSTLESRRNHVISYFKFDVYEMELTESKSNRLLINFTNADKDTIIRFTVYDGIERPPFIGYWSDTDKLYIVPFTLPPYPFNEYVDFKIEYPTLKYFSYQLDYYGFGDKRLKLVSTHSHRLPPVVESMEPSGGPSVSYPTGGGVFNWSFVLTTSPVPIKQVKASVISDADFFTINYTIPGSSSPGKFQFELPITVVKTPNGYCTSQQYRINYLEIEDMNGAVSFYEYNYITLIEPSSMIISPFLYIPSPSLVVTVTCQGGNPDQDPPFLTKFNQSVDSLDPLSNQRKVLVDFEISDAQSPISKTHLPYCYVHSMMFEKYRVQAHYVSEGSSNLVGVFSCLFNLPYGFGYPSNKLIFTISGYSDVYQNIGGVDYTNINIGNPLSLDIVSPSYDIPVIESAEAVTALVNNIPVFKLYIYGHRLGGDCQITIQFLTEGTIIHVEPVFSSGVLLVTGDIPIQSIRIFVKVKNYGNPSDDYLVILNDIPTPITPNTNSTPCLGTPQCGGTSNGECTSNGCKCIPPWIGNDCTSQIIVNQPNINTTSPDIDNNYNTTLPGGETVQLKALISILSLNEIKPNGELFKEHKLSQWLFSNITTDGGIQEYLYSSNITQQNQITNISVLIQYYKEETTIQFANNNIEMLPSTIKYRISLSPYSFNSSINSIEFIMSTSFSTTSSQKSCSYQETGITNDNSDYIKLQVNDHSLYGKFIKYALVDNRLQVISNRRLESSSSQEGTSTNRNIAIKLPHFEDNVIMDPDFSLLVDTTPASEKDNSICNSSSSKSLTKAQLAGIIVASCCGGILLILGLFYILYKKNVSFKVKLIQLAKLNK